METKANIIRKYAEASPETKVDIICKYYPQIDGIINARIAAMKYIIWEEKEKNRRVDYGELGVRVQSGNGYSDPTGNEASFRANLENAIRKCDFSGDILEGIGDSDKIIEEAYILKDMKEIQHLYDLQVNCLISEERSLFQKYLNQEMNLTDIASSCGIEYHSAEKKITKIRKFVKQEVTEILEVTSCHVCTKDKEEKRMYRAFELNIDKEKIEDVSSYRWNIELGISNVNNDVDKIKELLSDVIYNGTIDGTKLTEEYFPDLRRDVFLSYSHNDQDLAYYIVGILNSYFGLPVFVDSMFWGSADKLLKEIDNSYCLNNDGETYNYKKRNFSTSHVYVMLTSAIMKVMDQAEIVIFLNTPESAANLEETIENDGYDEYTLSPWIYEELLLTTMIKETDWEIYRQNLLAKGNILEHFERNLQVKYKLPKEKLIPLTFQDIETWHKSYEERKGSLRGRYGGMFLESYQKQKHPLNVLYELKCGVEE